ncbi:unnamed protein product [Dibothriocephalus latus]|uniref:Uncharacterized protein n=1 Tax=Dibothriocephalus latus TaxID=60516 RepID=A0A3P7MFX1_DIBLA|nr:unnamed protein product [Dibothriocephalus latus]
MADARMQTVVPNTETELYSLELEVIFKRMSSRTTSLRTIDRSIHMDKEARRQLRKVLGGSEERTKQFLAETTSPAGFLLYLTEILGDRGKALALLEEAAEGSVTAYDELLRLLPDTEKLTKILSSFEAASKEAILILAPNVLLLPHVTHLLHAIRLYNLGRDDVASLLAGKWTPIGQPDSKEFRYTETLHLGLQEMTDFLTAFMANDVDKLHAMAAVLPANLKRVMKENDIAERFGKPDLLPNLNKKVQIVDLLENPVEAVALSCSFNRENLFNDFKAPNLPTPLVNYIDGLLANWKWRCAWEALNVINKRDPPVDMKPIESLINHAGKLINLMEGNIRSTASNQLEPDEITQIVRQAIYGHPNYVLKLDELVGAKKRAFFLHGIHKTLGRVLMKLVHVILSGVDMKSIQEFLAALADIVVSPIMMAFLSTWQNLVRMVGGTYGCQIEMRQTEREREFEMAQELINLLTEVKSRLSLVQLTAPKSSSIITKQWGQQAIPLRNEDSVAAGE